MQTQFFCYVYAAPDGTPFMCALEADSLPDAIRETRRMMIADRPAAAFAEIWDGVSQGMIERIDLSDRKPAGLLRSVRRGPTSSGSSRP